MRNKLRESIVGKGFRPRGIEKMSGVRWLGDLSSGGGLACELEEVCVKLRNFPCD